MSTTFSKQPISEATEQIHFIKYVSMQYPNILLQHDLSKAKRDRVQGYYLKLQGWNKSYPDLFFPEPRQMKDGFFYSGLYIEMKRTGTKLFKKDGVTYATEHIKKQADMIAELMQRGYYATFCKGFEEAKETIDNYLKGDL